MPISDEKFKDYIGQIGDKYEELKDLVVKHCDNTEGMMELYGKLAEFRDLTCGALRDSHTTKNFNNN